MGNGKKRKLSDFTSAETSSLISLLTGVKEELDEQDREEKAFMKDLDKVLDKLQEVKTGGFLDANMLALVKANVVVGPLFLADNKRTEIRTLGQKSASGGLTIEETKKSIGLIREHVSFETEAGCRLLINAILVHAASNLDVSESVIIISPELRIPQTTLASNGSAYSGAVDYMMILSPKAYKHFLLKSPKLAFSNPDVTQYLSSNVYEAKTVDLSTAIPQAAMAAVVECQRHGFQTLRGCVSTGESWSFFVYNKTPDRNGGFISVLEDIKLKDDLSELTLILGFLYDWIMNGKTKKMEFCTYFPHDANPPKDGRP